MATWINQRANPATVGIMQYSGVFFSFMLDIFIFNQLFSGLEVLGVCICLLFSLITAIYKHYFAKKPLPVKNIEETEMSTDPKKI